MTPLYIYFTALSNIGNIFDINLHAELYHIIVCIILGCHGCGHCCDIRQLLPHEVGVDEFAPSRNYDFDWHSTVLFLVK